MTRLCQRFAWAVGSKGDVVYCQIRILHNINKCVYLHAAFLLSCERDFQSPFCASSSSLAIVFCSDWDIDFQRASRFPSAKEDARRWPILTLEFCCKESVALLTLARSMEKTLRERDMNCRLDMQQLFNSDCFSFLVSGKSLRRCMIGNRGGEKVEV